MADQEARAIWQICHYFRPAPSARPTSVRWRPTAAALRSCNIARVTPRRLIGSARPNHWHRTATRTTPCDRRGDERARIPAPAETSGSSDRAQDLERHEAGWAEDWRGRCRL